MPAPPSACSTGNQNMARKHNVVCLLRSHGWRQACSRGGRHPGENDPSAKCKPMTIFRIIPFCTGTAVHIRSPRACSSSLYCTVPSVDRGSRFSGWLRKTPNSVLGSPIAAPRDDFTNARTFSKQPPINNLTNSRHEVVFYLVRFCTTTAAEPKRRSNIQSASKTHIHLPLS